MFGDTLLNLMGHRDPRTQLLQAAMGGQPGGGATPGGGAGAPAVPPAGGAGQPPAAPPQPASLQTPPDMMELYTTLSERGRKANSIDKGIGLLASAFALPENRQLIMDSVSSEQMSDADLMSSVMSISNQQREIAEKAALQQKAMALAEELGIDPDAAAYLSETGQLGNLVTSRMTPKERETEVVGSDATGRTLIDKSTGEPIRKVTKPVKNPTTGENYRQLTQAEITERNLDPKKAYQIDANNKLYEIGGGGVTVNNNNNMGGTGGLSKADEAWIMESDKGLLEKGTVASGAQDTINSINNARIAYNRPGGIITGSVASGAELETRKVLASVFGIEDPAVVNSAEFSSTLGQVALDRISQLGTGNAISDGDRKYIADQVGQSNTIPIEAVPRILNIMELGSRQEVINYNEAVKARLEASRSVETGEIPAAIAATMKPLPVPTISSGWMERVPDGDKEQVVQFLNDPEVGPEFERLFDEQYGMGAARAVFDYLEKTGG